MELPKHTTQVGTIAANKKMYLEDYCISYMKQFTEESPDEKKQIALFGTLERDKNVEYAFVYGAALLGTGRGRTDSLTANQKEEAESIRAEFFEDYQLVGVVISTDAVNENIFWLGYGNKSIPLDGYYIFYDTNEAMLNFMMYHQKEERDIDLDPVIVKKADMDREKREKAEREKQEAQQKGGKYRKKMQEEEKTGKQVAAKSKSPFPAAACVLLLAACSVYGVKTYYPDFRLEQIPSYLANVREEVSVFGNSYLVKKEETETTEAAVSTEAEENQTVLEVVSTQVQQPAELDVVVIPDLETLGSEQAEEGKESEPIVETTQSSDSEATEPSEQQGPQEYFIQKGDNLLKILRAYYGDESKLQEVCDLNGIKDANNIQVGQTILLP